MKIIDFADCPIQGWIIVFHFRGPKLLGALSLYENEFTNLKKYNVQMQITFPRFIILIRIGLLYVLVKY